MTDLRDQSPLRLLTALLIAEAEGEPLNGRVAVACVVRNRTKDKRWPDTYEEVILQPKQFSCLNEHDPRRKVFLSSIDSQFKDPMWRECRWIAFGIINNWLRDITKGANHYNTIACDPVWEKGMLHTATIGRHEFFKG